MTPHAVAQHVQVDLEIACGSVNTTRLEQALRDAEFEPDSQRVWRWTANDSVPGTVVKFELLADLGDVPTEATVEFHGCDQLGAVNLRGTGFASRDVEVRELRTRVGGVEHIAEMNVTGLAGFLLASARLHGRGGRPRTGTTSPSSCCTTTPAARKTRLERCSTSLAMSWHEFEPRSMTCSPTSRRRTPRVPLPTRSR